MAIVQSRVAAVQAIYAAYYNRPADVGGLDFWTNQLQAANGNLTTIINAFGNSAEANALYTGSVENKVNQVYLALFNRPAEVAGLNFYVAEINAGRISLAGAAQAIAAGAQGADKTAFDNKVEAATKFTEALDTAPEVLAYSQNGAAEKGRDFLEGVTATSKPDAAAINKAVADLNTATTFDLTPGIDIKTANIFTANQKFNPAGTELQNTLNDGDVLTATGENSSLDASLGNAGATGGTIITPKLEGIKTVEVSFIGSGAVQPGVSNGAVTAVDFQDATGLDKVAIDRVSQSINSAELGNIKQAVSAIDISNTNANNAGTVEVSFANGVLNGKNAVTLTLQDVQVRNLNIGQNTSGINNLGVSAQGYETITLNTVGVARNSIATLNSPMDKDTDGSLKIGGTGTGGLDLGTTTNFVNATQAQLPEAVLFTAGTGLQGVGGRINTINASELVGGLTLVLDNVLDIGKADTSGVRQDVNVIGSAGNDTFVLFDAVQAGVAGSAGDKIDGGAGNDTVVLSNGADVANTISKVENVQMLIDANTAGAAAATAVVANYDFLLDATSTVLRNVSTDTTLAGANIDAASGVATFTLRNLSAAQAGAISIQHSTTGQQAGGGVGANDLPGFNNGDITFNVISANLKTNTANDTLAVTIQEATNTAPRFNFTIDSTANLAAGATATTFENLTINDNDTESNTIRLQNFANQTGTVTINGGLAGTFLNLDMLDTAVNLGGRGIRSLATDGTAVDNFNGTNTNNNGASVAIEGLRDAGANTTYQRLGSAIIDGSTSLADLVVRVGNNAASGQGAQKITTGAGNDFVVFDLIDATQITVGTAGLTGADSVDGGANTAITSTTPTTLVGDVLAIDGDGRNIVIQQSEWDNVKNFETIYLAGNGGAFVAGGAARTANSYYLQLDNDLIDNNGGDLIRIVNDDQSQVNNAGAGALPNNTDVSTDNRSATIFATGLNAFNHFAFDGEEGTGATMDRFVVNDQNTNGGNIIDGGNVNISNDITQTVGGVTTNAAAVASRDVLEVRNSATVTISDLANIRNVGVISFQNDQAVAQTLTLSLDDATVDSLVDSGHTATNAAGRVEQILVLAGDRDAAVLGAGNGPTDEAGNAFTSSQATRVVINAQTLGTASALRFEGSTGGVLAANDVINIGLNLGATTAHILNGGDGTDTLNLFGNIANQTLTVNAGVNYVINNGQPTQTTNTLSASFTNINLSNLTGTATAGVIAINGTAGADSLTGSAAADVITGGGGADQLAGGAGADTFAFAAASSGGVNGAAVADVIADFVAGTDKLQFTAVADVVSAQQAAVQVAVTGLAAGSTDAQIAEAMAAANATDLGVAFAVFNGSTYVLFEGTGAGNTYVQAEDVFIKLTGVTTLPTFAADVIA